MAITSSKKIPVNLCIAPVAEQIYSFETSQIALGAEPTKLDCVVCGCSRHKATGN